MRVVICGGGVIAACTAYFLARRGVEVIVVERKEVACAASGKAGGFLALDWCAGSALDALARRSFALHAQLVNELGGNWAYRRMNAYSGYVVADRDARRSAPSRLSWLREGVVISGQLGNPQTTAIVHPRKFTTALMHAAQNRGAQLRSGCVTGLLRSAADSVVSGVEIDGEPLAADATLIAMGPWSILAAQWLPLPAVLGQQSPSLVYDTGTSVPADALFLEYRERSGAELSVEVFPRADGSTHVTAFSSQNLLPLDPAQIAPEADAIERLQAICERLSPAFQSDRIIARQACFRPVTQDFLPLIGKVPAIDGAYIATGHNVWGILNAPATGEATSELIADGVARSTDLTPFDPARLRAVDPGRVRANVI
jgi:glycine/D-amino acid oxidase-like deaminating enzyme